VGASPAVWWGTRRLAVVVRAAHASSGAGVHQTERGAAAHVPAPLLCGAQTPRGVCEYLEIKGAKAEGDERTRRNYAAPENLTAPLAPKAPIPLPPRKGLGSLNSTAKRMRAL
jgi:hypothetical protein